MGASGAAASGRAALSAGTGLGFRQPMLVRWKTGSQTQSTGGSSRMMTAALMRAPRASMEQMEPMISMSEATLTPSVAAKSTRALVRMEESEDVAAAMADSFRSFQAPISSWKAVVSRVG